MRRRIAVEDVFALLDEVAFLNRQMLALRDEIFDRLLRIVLRHDADAALVLVVAPEFDATRDFGDDRVVLRTARLEQLGNTRQTAGDVAGLGAFERDTGENVACLDLGTGIDRQNGIDRQQIAGFAATRQLVHFAVLVLDDHGRLEAVAALVAAPVDDRRGW